jgi:hypothetical protein
MLRFPTFLYYLLSAMSITACPASAPGNTVAREVVNTGDDLPRFTYPISGTATDLVRTDDATFAPFAARVRANVDSLLDGYDIRDHATLRELYSTRLNLQLLANDNAGAIRTIEMLRSLNDKPDGKILTGITSMAVARARLATGQTSGAAYARAFSQSLTTSLNELPWKVVGNGVKQRRGAALVSSSDNMLGYLQAAVEPAVLKSHQLSGEGAAIVVGARLFIRYVGATLPQELAALTDYIKTHDVPKPDIWPARDVTLTADDHLTPVAVAIWDVGTDLSLFPGRTFVDPTPGSSADPHGLAYDIDFRPSHGDLYPLTPAQHSAYPASLADIKGSSDLEASIESPEADGLRRKLAALSPGARAEFMETNRFYGGYYIHGTHVADIAARGNPAIRLAVARTTWDWHNVPIALTEEVIGRQIAAYQSYADWFRTRRIRIVNMSWGETPGDFEANLEANGIGKDATERKVLARQLFERDRDGMRRAMASAPDVLFVSASGNSDDDSGFTEDAPSSFDMPNLLTVGAVDQAGEEAAFTTYGKVVRVHASGYQVASVVPGGAKLRLTGTSMASPAVVNLAAKLLALDPALTPAEVIRIIIAGTNTSADGRLHIINPKASIGMLPKRR